MRYIPHTEDDTRRMLEATGAESVEALFEQIPESIRRCGDLDLPDGVGEQELLRELEALASLNGVSASFQGAGAYAHFVPSVVKQILSRSEFATTYTPYQPEVSQGTLQACFEFQTYVSILTGFEIANASLYDGASALAEAVLMALRIGRKRRRVLISEGVHPEYVEVVRSYLEGARSGVIEVVPLAADGRTDLAELDRMLDDQVAVVCAGYPNVFGAIEDLEAISSRAAAHKALTVSATTEALALALLKAPGSVGVDIAVAEGQSLGLPTSYGGPGIGLFATHRKHVRQMPGRLAGETVDENGRRGYVLTLSTREQHIRREKATSNICTNQGLVSLAVTVYLGLQGREGLRALAEKNAGRAQHVAERLQNEAGITLAYDAPFFNEFTVRAPSVHQWFEDAVSKGLVPGVRWKDLLREKTSTDDRVIIAVTECNTDEQIDLLVQCLAGRRAA